MGSIRVEVHGALDASLELAALRKTLRDRILVRSMDRAGKVMEVEASRGIRDEINLTRADVGHTLKVRKPTPANPEVALVVSSEPVPLGRFAARQIASGVSVQVLRSGARKVRKGAFLAQMQSGRRNVWDRKGGHDSAKVRRVKSGPNVGKRYFASLPIEQHFGPEPYQVVVNKDGLVEEIQERGEEVFAERFLHELNRALRE